MEGTANDMARLTGRGSVRASELFDPDINIELGTQFMKTLGDRYGDHPCLVFAGYNGGHGNVNRWLRERGQLELDLWVEEIPYEQTRHYVKRVTMSWWVYRWLYVADRLPSVDLDLPEID
jgi:soluble lytic murein transglycosylase